MKKLILFLVSTVLYLIMYAEDSNRLAYMKVTTIYGSTIEIPIYKNTYISFIESSYATGYNRLIRVVSNGIEYDVIKHHASNIIYYSVNSGINSDATVVSDKWRLNNDIILFDMVSEKNMSIYTISGISILEKILPQGQSMVSIASLQPGIYILTIGTESIKITKR